VSSDPRAAQTAWAELVVATLADAGVRTCVVSPGSRSTPLVAALAGEPRLATPIVIDERAAAFCALGAARASGEPVALVCTSGTAAAHWLPALIEASEAAIPLIAITADRPPELFGCGAPQTIDQVKLFGGFARAYVDLGAADGGALALRAVRRKIAQAVAVARGPHAGPVHVEVPLRKPLEPYVVGASASTSTSTSTCTNTSATDAAVPEPLAIARALAAEPLVVAPPPVVCADAGAIAAIAAVLRRAERPLLVAGPAHTVPVSAAARDAVIALARAAGAVVLAETTSGLRLGPWPDDVVAVDAFDPLLAAAAGALAPDAIVQLGGELAAAAWPAARVAWAGAPRWVLAPYGWPDPDSSATGMVRGDVGDAARRIAAALDATPRREAWHARWREAGARARAAVDAAIETHPGAEAAVVRATIEAAPEAAVIVVGNSLPARVIDHVAATGGRSHAVSAQRGACGIDGLVAGAAGATWAGTPVIAIVGDVSFAHDLGGVAAAVRVARAPLVIVVVDNAGGRIFDGLPIAATAPAALMTDFFHTAPGLDPAAVARALGAEAITAASPAAVAAAVRAGATGAARVTIVHAPVSPDGAVRVRRAAIDALAAPAGRGARP
jgi:2-succinyl-5-enolpyruvyl-6-hydroxy-3-cyclohexene-1-carboxylate synthase